MESIYSRVPPLAIVVGGVLLAGYVTLCAALRFRFERAMRQRYSRYTAGDRASLAAMTNDDAQQIMDYIVTMEFPFIYEKGLQFALFKTYGIPTISKTLVATKAFVDPDAAPKRYEDTGIIYAEFTLSPPTSERAIQAISRMNCLHSQYIKAGMISNADLLYTLAVSALVPIRFIDMFDWRRLNDLERCAFGTFWKSIGDAMAIEYTGYLSKTAWTDGIDWLDDLAAWTLKYEMDHMKPAPQNRQVAVPLVGMLLQLAPAFARPFATSAVHALMGDRVRDAFMFPEPSAGVTALAFGALAMRRFVIRHLALPRRSPRRILSEKDPQTGRIRHFEYLSEPWYIEPTFWNRWGPMALMRRAVGAKLPGAATKSGEKDFLPCGYRFEDIGPTNYMGKGRDTMELWEQRLKRERPSGCPFGKGL